MRISAQKASNEKQYQPNDHLEINLTHLRNLFQPLSKEKVEKVENPPQKPVIHNSLA